ncbi:MAG: penicillin-binding protein 2 [Prevotella sp.]|nr:penicillin-binding protein 2 [Prevotella sp.]
MPKDSLLENRKYVIGGVAVFIVTVYIIRLFALQIMSDDYKRNADSNAFMKKVDYPARGVISDRKGTPLVYSSNSYDLMVIMHEAENRIDTAEFCSTLGISKEYFINRMNEIKDRSKNPGYSRFTQQVFMNQLSEVDFSIFQEKLYRFPGFYAQRRSIRQYSTSNAAHVLGDVGEVSPSDIMEDTYYQAGDYIGKTGVEKFYEKQLRGEKGIQIMLRDARGRIKGSYMDGKFDRKPVPGKNLTLSLDIELQELGERLMEGKIGSIVAIEPSTGEVLCMVSSPTFDPRLMTGRNRGKMQLRLAADPLKPLLNRAIMGMYPPGSTFKPTQGLIFLSEGIITPSTGYPCTRGFYCKGMHVGCHGHEAPLSLIPAIGTSCNGFFCWGLYYMLENRKKYKTVEVAIDKWRDYMVSMGFGYRLGVDLPGEKRGLIPNGDYYDKAYKSSWNGLSIVSISIGQGEVLATPLQIANLGATIANRGYYYTPHVVKKVQDEPLEESYKQRHYTDAKTSSYEYIVRGMRQAVISGTCKGAQTSYFEVCGKTGTAQNHGRDHSAFMGFAPMNSPKIAVAVYVENGGWGATFGVPIGALIMEKYINGELSDISEAKAKAIQARHISYGLADR